MLISEKDFISFLKKLSQEEIGHFDQVIVPVESKQKENDTFFHLGISEELDINLTSFRIVDPTKILFYLTREKVFPAPHIHSKRLLVGIKNCDLNALKLMDSALINDEFIDPAYQNWRNTTIIISSDCYSVNETCHCNLVEEKPWVESGSDLNIAKVEENLLLTPLTDNGKEILVMLGDHYTLRQVDTHSKSVLGKQRKDIFQKLKDQNSLYDRENHFEKIQMTEIEAWLEESRECIGCGGCTNICPTCYCLILNDESLEDFVKVRSYDSCQLNGYARVAGGASPRPKMTQRFRNRYLCKFVFMKKEFDIIGCTGCGRCIDVCPAKIDFRDVFKKMLDKKPELKTSSIVVN